MMLLLRTCCGLKEKLMPLQGEESGLADLCPPAKASLSIQEMMGGSLGTQFCKPLRILVVSLKTQSVTPYREYLSGAVVHVSRN